MLPSSGTTVAWHRDGLSGQCCRGQPGTEQSMAAQTVVKRVEALERQMSEMSDLSVRVAELGTQFSQFRVEVRAEFSAIRAEIAGPRADVTDVQAQVKGLQSQVKGLRAELSDMRAATAEEFTAVRAEIRAGDEETRHQMRVLHEDLVGRIALLQEGLRSSTPRTRGRANAKRSKRVRLAPDPFKTIVGPAEAGLYLPEHVTDDARSLSWSWWPSA